MPVIAKKWAKLRLADRVRAAGPLAQEILLGHGIDCDPEPGLEDIVARVARLTSDRALEREYKEMTENDLTVFAERLEAAQALGIALGLRLRSEAFDGGAR